MISDMIYCRILGLQNAVNCWKMKVIGLWLELWISLKFRTIFSLFDAQYVGYFACWYEIADMRTISANTIVSDTGCISSSFFLSICGSIFLSGPFFFFFSGVQHSKSGHFWPWNRRKTLLDGVGTCSMISPSNVTLSRFN